MRPLAIDELRLEPLEARHAEEMYEVLRDPALYLHLDSPPPPSAEHLRKLYGRLESRKSDDGADHWLNWVVRHGRAATGFVQATVTPRHDAWIAFVFARAHHGRGFAFRATRAMMDCLTRDYGVERFVATVEADNGPSIRLLERLGFTLAGAVESKDLPPGERLYVRR